MLIFFRTFNSDINGFKVKISSQKFVQVGRGSCTCQERLPRYTLEPNVTKEFGEFTVHIYIIYIYIYVYRQIDRSIDRQIDRQIFVKCDYVFCLLVCQSDWCLREILQALSIFTYPDKIYLTDNYSHHKKSMLHSRPTFHFINDNNAFVQLLLPEMQFVFQLNMLI